jgi:hypothetical protein
MPDLESLIKKTAKEVAREAYEYLQTESQPHRDATDYPQRPLREDPRPRAYATPPPVLAIEERKVSALEAIAEELKRFNNSNPYERR